MGKDPFLMDYRSHYKMQPKSQVKLINDNECIRNAANYSKFAAIVRDTNE